MSRRGSFSPNSVGGSEFRGVGLLCVFCAFGILLGCFSAKHISNASLIQLQSYLTAYAELQTPRKDIGAIFRTAVIYFRYSLLLLFFGFCSIGAYLVPVLCLWQGFTLAFTATVFAGCVERGILLAVTLLALRCIILFPTTLFCGFSAMQSALSGNGGHSGRFWRRFGISFCILLFGAVLELTIVPRIFFSVYSN